MALNKATLKSDIYNKVKAIDLQKSDVADKIAEAIADAVDTYIKTATITVAPGIQVATAGSAAAQVGSTTSTGTATIS